ncbi:hypothetical protein L280_08090 [Mannheimia haemolytica MhBrain2012]|nr:hypothetical protein F382_09365 [Mannheimia haemolytica D153]AGQ41690.1 hypothetical protein J451_09585 [Mannheimia haemolytica D174]AGR74070.1 hypothetical protein N220_01445 [Mannheimia haemolytica USMARC_2286]EPY99297.1 hypothetical protein L278_02025 [Mannheimia haemolytica D35]EPZ01752.1 hypothetical protein L279_11880 [Mannheimia haemolytica D38]EPZ25299.1 hypothetical protein L280_08090 [Mannheimia haemolytica MhBrain2012]EPZ26286.1 hypothetical protein L281_13210 [Mannheimia haemol
MEERGVINTPLIDDNKRSFFSKILQILSLFFQQI